MALGEKSCGKKLGTTCTEIKVGHFHQNTRKKTCEVEKKFCEQFHSFVEIFVQRSFVHNGNGFLVNI